MNESESDHKYYINGKRVWAGIERVMEADGDEFWCAAIGDYDTWDSIELKNFDNPRSAARWLSKTLDNKPKVFGSIDLRIDEARKAVRADGAEHYVMGYLMLAYGIVATRANRNMPGYDILAYLPATQKSCRIQVKYRESTDFILLKNADFDFLVVITDEIVDYKKNYSISGLDQEIRSVKNWTAYIAPRDRVIDSVESKKYFKIGYGNYWMNWKLIFDFLS
ncbi:hypothetical protein [Ralstonia wenshanensis]|uniref:Uncharacterized protein n=1 Tax=Ralstonia wenshanensis TaxID=2842456 RepID=A0AAD2AWK0_9RALS|nr:hypothetical protein [Ralstonia wenshanensis]CAJ0691877.1 hypothetical protein LMG18091_01520 [Ralstonia wenshanensis]